MDVRLIQLFLMAKSYIFNCIVTALFVPHCFCFDLFWHFYQVKLYASFILFSFIYFFSEVIHVNFRIYWPQQKSIELQMLQWRNKAKEFNISSGPNCRALYIHKVRSGAM